MAANYLAGPDEWTANDGTMLYSPSALQGKRAYALSLARNQKEARNAGDGISNAANSMFAAMLMRDADAADQKMLGQQKEGGQLFSDAMKTPGSTGVQQTYSAPGASNTGAYTPGTPVTPSAWDAAIDKHVPEDMRPYARALLKGEGGTNGQMSSTGAWGGYQFTKGTGQQYGLVGNGVDLRNDPEAATKAVVALTQDNRAALAKALGRDPTWQETALAHQQGAGGASALLTNPNAQAGSVVDPRNLSVNRVDPRLNAGAAAQQIMQYYKIPDGPQPQGNVQVAQNGPNAQMGVQMAPGVYTFGGGTGSGITPQHIAAAKWAMANPSLATAEQKAMASDIFKRAQEPGQLQDIGNGMWRTPEGNFIYRTPAPVARTEGQILTRQTPDGREVPVEMGGGSSYGNDIGGHRTAGTVGRSAEQMATAKTYGEFRRNDASDAVAAANERGRLGELSKALTTTNWRGPATAYIQPLREWARNLGVPDTGAINGQSLEMVSRSMMGTLKTMADNGRITQGEYQNLATVIPNLGTLPGAEKQLMEVLYNSNARRVALGHLASAYDTGALGPDADKKYMELRKVIANDTNAVRNFGVDDQTGMIGYRNPMTGTVHQFGSAR